MTEETTRLTDFMDRLVAATIIVAAAFSVCARGASGDSGLGDPPAGVVAWWRFQPVVSTTPAEASRRALLEATLRASVASGLVSDGDALQTISGLLTASALFASPHQVAVLDVDAPDDRDGLRVEGMRVVVEIGGEADHRALVRTLQSVLVDAPVARGAAPGEQHAVSLPDGGEAVAFRRDDWPAWLEISWRSTPGSFDIGIGRGALSAWLERRGDGSPAWAAHRAFVGERRAGASVLELFVDLNSLRAEAPGWFGGGVGTRLLEAWDLSNARCFMLHAHLLPASAVAALGRGAGAYEGPPMLVVDATWESRTDAPGSVRFREVTPSAWPATVLRMPPTRGRFVMLTPTRTLSWLARAIETRGAIEVAGGDAAGTRTWLARQTSRLRRLERATAPQLVVTDAPDSPVGLPMLGTLYAELEPGVGRDAYERELGRVLGTLGDRVSFDEDSRIWTLRLFDAAVDPAGAVRVLALGMADGARPVLIVAWSAMSVEDARAALEAP